MESLQNASDDTSGDLQKSPGDAETQDRFMIDISRFPLTDVHDRQQAEQTRWNATYLNLQMSTLIPNI